MRQALALVCLALAAAAVLSGCGEKAEPSLKSLSADYREQQQEQRELAILGDYEGKLHQQGMKPFKVTATVASLVDESENRVHYTGIDCSGTWDFRSQKQNAYVFREIMNPGNHRRCKSIGTVTLTPEGANQYEYEFRGGGVTSTGTLRRSG